MEKLNELEGWCQDVVNTWPATAKLESFNHRLVRDVAEAFRALEQRAEAAEARLAELEKQEPIDFRWRWASDENAVWTYCHMDRLPDAVAAFGDNVTFELVYNRPAPAADLVLDDTKRMDWLVSMCVEVRKHLRYGSEHVFHAVATTDEEDDYHATTLREQIDAILRKIEEAKK